MADDLSSCPERSNDSANTDERKSNGDDGDEIEQPRLEDSRASLLLLPPEPPVEHLMQLLPHYRGARNPLLSSTVMQEAGLDSDWPNASSIRLANSHDSVGLSDLLNNADIGLEVSATSSASAAAAAAATVASITESADFTESTSSSISSVGGDASSGASVSSIPTSDSDPDSSPRLRVLASATVGGRSDDDGSVGIAGASKSPAPQRHAFQHQQALGLLQVCRLTLDVLSEGDLLRDGTRHWLTPELLCDKLCDRLRCPATVTDGAPHSPSSIASDSPTAAMDFESPTGRIRHWLMACGGGSQGSPLMQNTSNSV